MSQSSPPQLHQSDPRLRGRFPRTWMGAWLAAVFFCLFAALNAEAAPDWQDDAGAGSLMFVQQGTDGRAYRPATRLDSHVSITISGPVARVTVEQRFRNTGSEWVEGIYVFPLPGDAAVDAMTLEVGERVIVGEIQSREKARKKYETARQSGQRASIVEQQRPNLFSTSVANIAPGSEIMIRIAYQQVLTLDGGRLGLHFPMTLTPRFIPDPAGDTDDAQRISPPFTADQNANQVTFNIDLDAGFPVEDVRSQHHPIVVTPLGTRHAITLRDATVSMDRDFQLSWRPQPGAGPGAALFTEQLGSRVYGLLMFLPPQWADAGVGGPVPPREMIFVIDTSGSMQGQSITQAQRSLRMALELVNPQDRFNIVRFASGTSTLFDAPRLMDSRTREEAHAFIKSLTAEGGTQFGAALAASLGQDRARRAQQDGFLRQVVFITDGSVGNEHELLAGLPAQIGSSRLYTVAIGSAPNRWFLRKAAKAGRGTFVQISDNSEVEQTMNGLFRRLSNPVLVDTQVNWPAGAVVDGDASRIPDLHIGEPLLVTAQWPAAPGPNPQYAISARGKVAGVPWQRRFVARPDNARPGIATVWARSQIDRLMDDGRAAGNLDSVRDAVTALALEHHLVSRFTSLVAVDATPARSAGEPLQRDALANRVPAGSTAGFPATATAAPWLRFIGIVLLLVSLLVLLAPIGKTRLHCFNGE